MKGLLKVLIILLVAQVATTSAIGQKAQKDASPIVYDFVPDAPYELVQDRLNCLESTIPYNFNERVYAFINYFTFIDRDYARMVIQRAEKYFPLIEKYLAKHNMPDEIKYLAIVESGLNPKAISRAGAAGLWQFMSGTGRYFKLHTDWYIDERFDPYEATEAACLYLKQLHQIFGDWELALAAYNAGPGNVRKAIRRSGYKKKFWEIYRYLPRETRSYVPQFVAMAYTLNYHEAHNIFPEAIEPQIEFDTVFISQYLHVKTLTKELNVCLEDLQKLNPAIKWNALPENVKQYPLRIPSDKMPFYREHEKQILQVAGSTGKKEIEYLARNTVGSTYGREKRIHKVRSGDVLGTIAQKYRVRLSDIRKWNGIRGNLIRVGQRLAIWVYPGSAPKETRTVARANTTKQPANPNSKVYFVQPGDTLWDISKMYQGLSIEKIKRLNNLKSNKIMPGQKLVLG